MYLATRRAGRIWAGGAVGLGLSSLAVAFRLRRGSQRVTALLACAISLGAAYYLFTRLYLNDIRVRRACRMRIGSTPLSQMLHEYHSIGNLRVALTAQSTEELEEIVALLGPRSASPTTYLTTRLCNELFAESVKEMATLPIGVITTTYTPHQIQDLLKHGILSRVLLEQMLSNAANTAKTLGSFINSIRGPNGESLVMIAESLRGTRVFTRNAIMRLLENEFSWIFARTAKTSTFTDVPKLETTIRTVVAHEVTLAKAFGFSLKELGNIIEQSPRTTERPVDVVCLLEAGLADLAERGITSLAYRDSLVMRSLPTRRSLWELESRFGVRRLLGLPFHYREDCSVDGHIVQQYDQDVCKVVKIEAARGKRLTKATPKQCFSPQGLRALFAAAIPMDIPSGYESLPVTPATNIVAFVLYWGDLITSSPQIVPASHTRLIKDVISEAEHASEKLRCSHGQHRLPLDTKDGAVHKDLAILEDSFRAFCLDLHKKIAVKRMADIGLEQRGQTCSQM